MGKFNGFKIGDEAEAQGERFRKAQKEMELDD